MYWFDGMVFIIAFFYYFYKLKQGGISRMIPEWDLVRRGDLHFRMKAATRDGMCSQRRWQGPCWWLEGHAADARNSRASSGLPKKIWTGDKKKKEKKREEEKREGGDGERELAAGEPEVSSLFTLVFFSSLYSSSPSVLFASYSLVDLGMDDEGYTLNSIVF